MPLQTPRSTRAQRGSANAHQRRQNAPGRARGARAREGEKGRGEAKRREGGAGERGDREGGGGKSCARVSSVRPSQPPLTLPRLPPPPVHSSLRARARSRRRTSAARHPYRCYFASPGRVRFASSCIMTSGVLLEVSGPDPKGVRGAMVTSSQHSKNGALVLSSSGARESSGPGRGVECGRARRRVGGRGHFVKTVLALVRVISMWCDDPSSLPIA